MTTYNDTGIEAPIVFNKLTKTQLDNASSLDPTEIYLVDKQFIGNKLLRTDTNGDIVEGELNSDDVVNGLGYTPANDTTVVHKTGTETISGTKTFSARQDFSSNASDKVYIKHTTMDKTTTPSSLLSNSINFRDKNAVTMGYITQQQDTDGSSRIRLLASAYETGTTTVVENRIDIIANKDGTVETYAPTPAADSNDNNIATTEFVKSNTSAGMIFRTWSA